MKNDSKKRVGAYLERNGVSFRVWAPFASQVAVIGSFNNWSENALESEQDGYWYGHVKGAISGQEYKFVIRNGDAVYVRNDPRAMYFTTNYGNSVIGGGFDWEDDNFTPPPVEQQVIYEIHVGTFNRPDPSVSGSFRDIRDKLDYIAGLGVNMIELMPVCSMVMDRGWGYATDYIYAVESLYGGRLELLKLIKAAHQKGIGVILDVVYNHFGPDEKLDLWQFDGWSQDGHGGIYFYNDWRAETPWGNTRPDYGRPEVKQYILDNVKMWMNDCRVDGLRVDSTIFIRNVKGYNNDPGNDLTEGWQLLQGINDLARKINPDVITIAEDIADNDYITKPVKDGGAGFGSQWELGFPYALKAALHTSDAAYIDLTGICSQLVRRFNNDAYQRVVFVDSHDSAANDGSARFNELVDPGRGESLYARRRMVMAAGLVLTAPGVPMIFYGQEFMQPGRFNDWQGLDWQRATRHAGIVEAHRQLIALRKNTAGLTAGLTGRNINLMHVNQNDKVIAYHRWNNGGPKDDVIVVVNFTDIPHKDYVIGFPRRGIWKVRFNSSWKGFSDDFKGVDVDDVSVETGEGRLTLPPASVLILSQDD